MNPVQLSMKPKADYKTGNCDLCVYSWYQTWLLVSKGYINLNIIATPLLQVCVCARVCVLHVSPLSRFSAKNNWHEMNFVHFPTIVGPNVPV